MNLLIFWDGDDSFYQFSHTEILFLTIFAMIVIAAVIYLAVNSYKIQSKTGDAEYIGATAKVVTLDADKKSGQVEVWGETWRFQSSQEMKLEEKVTIEAVQGLTLTAGKR